MTLILYINGLEQRLIQIFAYSAGANLLHELMYMGIYYAFNNSVSLNLENIKSNFLISNLIQYKNLINIKPLFETNLNCRYYIINYNSLLFRKFYNIINKINPILNILNFIINIGARSNKIQYEQIVSVRGFLNTSRNYVTKFPLIRNFENGLNLTEYIISSYGVRKGLLDTSIQTSESGYLTRRLVEVVNDIIIKEKNCGSIIYFILRKYNSTLGCLKLPNIYILFNKYIYYNTIFPTEFYIRSPIFCYSGRSFCNRCLGFSYNNKLLGGDSIGVISGESLGEPSTQLTLRTFHTGGVLKNNKIWDLYEFNIINNKNLSTYYIKNNLMSITFTKNITKNKIFKFINKNKIIFKNLNIILFKQLSYNFIKYFSNFLSLYSFNNFITYPNDRSFIKYKYNKINTYSIFKNFINLYSFYCVKKNIYNKWIIIYLTNNLSYILKYLYTVFYSGGLYVTNMLNFSKINVIYNYTIIYK